MIVPARRPRGAGIQHPEASVLTGKAIARRTARADIVPSPPAGTVPIERRDYQSAQVAPPAAVRPPGNRRPPEQVL